MSDVWKNRSNFIIRVKKSDKKVPVDGSRNRRG